MHKRQMAKDGLVLFREELLQESPCCSYIISKGNVVVDEFHGGFSLLEPYRISASKETIFDLASLTKPLCTALIALKAFSSGSFDIYEPVKNSTGRFTPLDLLRHEAGFPSWIPIYRYGSKEEAKDALLNKIELKNTGGEAVYSCPGYILLGFLLEEKLGGNLDDLFIKLLRGPLGIEKEEALFSPPHNLRDIIAGTELRGEFEKQMAGSFGCIPPAIPEEGLWGIVHDGNSRFLNGAAGNSGLFATLSGTFNLAKAFLPSNRFLPPDVLKLVYNKGRAGKGEYRSAGFKLKGSPSWAVGEALRAGSVAHEGFTGTFAAITEEEEIMILLTNRIHPTHPRRSFSPRRVSFLNNAFELLK
jgi:serine-type D-Ala-D-Ala carboxypeptidase